jgi:hypothetical protein
MGFGSLQHIKVRRSTFRGLKPCPLRSAFRVWLPSWRLTPAEPVPVLFHTGGAPGIRPSELSPRGRYPPRFRAEGPTYRFTRRYSQRRSVGPAQRAAVPGLCPFRESLAVRRGLARRPLDAPLGFALLGSASDSLVRGFTRTPPTRFVASISGIEPTGAPEFRSAFAWPCPPRPANRAKWTGQPFQGLCTSTIPHTRASQNPGYVFTSYRAVHCCRQADNPWVPSSLYRSCPGVA